MNQLRNAFSFAPLLSALCALFPFFLNAQLGSIDPSFQIGSGAGGTFPRVETMVQQPDGKLLVGGWFSEFNGEPQRYIVRLNADGSVDDSFTSPFVEDFGTIVYAIVVQPDGKLLVGGEFDDFSGQPANRLVRLNSDGSVDDSFNIASGFNNYVTAIALQPDGKIIVGGLFTQYDGSWGGIMAPRNGIARLNADGSLDDTFQVGTGLSGGAGIGQRQVHQILVQPDGKVVVAGHFSAYNGAPAVLMVRLNADGSLDDTFNTSDAFVMVFGFYGQVYELVRLSDGKFLIAGNYAGPASGITRLNEDGSVDDTFVVSPAISDHRIFALDVQSDGKILVTAVNFGLPEEAQILRRYLPDGTLDADFPTTFFNELVTSIVVQQDGNIVLGGWFSYNPNGLMRIIGDTPEGVGVSDMASGTSSVLVYPNPAEDFIYIEGLPVHTQIVLRDMSGRIVLTERISGSRHFLNTSPLESGMYVMQCVNRSSSFAGSIIVR
jgi:uncharacterized delta-60 repeat protein